MTIAKLILRLNAMLCAIWATHRFAILVPSSPYSGSKLKTPDSEALDMASNNKNAKPATAKAAESKPPAANAPRKPKTAPGGKPFAERMAEAAMKNLKLAPCKYCNRKFQDSRLEDHQRICSRLQKKVRKPYDSQRHRLSGTVAEPFLKAGSKSQKPERSPPNNWRKKHEELVQAMLNAQAVEAHLAAGGKAADLPPPPPSDYSDYVQCPFCGRRFNENAAARHIPQCKDMVHNKPGGAVGTGNAFTSAKVLKKQ